MKSMDPVDRAFALLRADDVLPRPDRSLEAELRARYETPLARRRFGRLPLVLAVIGLSGVAAAASGAVEWLQSWWVVVDVDGLEVSGTVEDGRTTTIPFETADGTTGTVRVQRDLDESGGERTRIAIDSHSDGRIEAERLDVTSGPRAEERYPVSEIDGACLLYAGEDDETGPFEFFAVSGDGSGSRLFLLQDDGSVFPVLEVARLPFDILSPSAHAEFTELEAGAVSLSLSDGQGGVIEFAWKFRRASTERAASSLHSRDGAVRVRVESALDHSPSTDS